MSAFKLASSYQPTGDQPQAIKSLVNGYNSKPEQVLLGVTGSGKTFTMANVIKQINKPTLVLSHNKTLAVQLYEEFKAFFPENKVCFFVSYYDYYQPESYLPSKDMYIEKETEINEKIEEYRMEAVTSLLTRNDVIVIASVSAIYGLGSPINFKASMFELKVGQEINRREFLHRLVNIHYERNDMELRRGRFRVRGDSVELIPGYGREQIKIEFFGDVIEKISIREAGFSTSTKKSVNEVMIYPVNPFVIDSNTQAQALQSIEAELKDWLPQMEKQENGMLMAHRLKQRTKYDMEMIAQIGTCKGIENYSRHFDGRKPGEPPNTLINFFPDEFLMVLDESHATVPQIRGMHAGDKSRKQNLVDYGFRLPSAFDNRPLRFDEFSQYMNHVIYMSATPGDYELQRQVPIVEQIIRPTGLIDPSIEVRPITGQIEDLLAEIKITVENNDRVLITTLTKKMAEDLADFLAKEGVKVRYLHSEIDTMERAHIIRDLRLGKYDVLVGINLLREGLDIPEVGLVAILDADKEGFLRNYRSLIQTIGRTARNVRGRVLMYANKVTDSMQRAIDETARRRQLQMDYNDKHNITPQTTTRGIIVGLEGEDVDKDKSGIAVSDEFADIDDKNELRIKIELAMNEAADNLEFERAIELRELLRGL